MAGPFPGMDPWLESASLWPELHDALAHTSRSLLTPLLPPRYFVKVKHRHVTDLVSPEDLNVVIPDASVLHRPSASTGSPPPASTAVITRPLEVKLELPLPGKQPYLEVFDVTRARVIAAIEILSPSNKQPGSRDRYRYLRKRDAYLAGEIHFLEIDLLRGGERWKAGDEPAADYRVFLSRAGRRLTAEVWPVALRDRLPVVPVPLAGGDADVPLDLQAVLDRSYVEAGFERFVPYDQPPPAPPLSEADLAWARERIASTSR